MNTELFQLRLFKKHNLFGENLTDDDRRKDLVLAIPTLRENSAKYPSIHPYTPMVLGDIVPVGNWLRFSLLKKRELVRTLVDMTNVSSVDEVIENHDRQRMWLDLDTQILAIEVEPKFAKTPEAAAASFKRVLQKYFDEGNQRWDVSIEPLRSSSDFAKEIREAAAVTEFRFSVFRPNTTNMAGYIKAQEKFNEDHGINKTTIVFAGEAIDKQSLEELTESIKRGGGASAKIRPTKKSTRSKTIRMEKRPVKTSVPDGLNPVDTIQQLAKVLESEGVFGLPPDQSIAV
jgi:hypothetical protein